MKSIKFYKQFILKMDVDKMTNFNRKTVAVEIILMRVKLLKFKERKKEFKWKSNIGDHLPRRDRDHNVNLIKGLI